MTDRKICPLLSIAAEMKGSTTPPECQGTRCAWYVPPIYRGSEARCAVQALGALPYLASEVAKL